MKPVFSYKNLLKPEFSYENLLKPVFSYENLLKAVVSYENLLKPVLSYENLFKPVFSYGDLLKPGFKGCRTINEQRVIHRWSRSLISRCWLGFRFPRLCLRGAHCKGFRGLHHRSTGLTAKYIFLSKWQKVGFSQIAGLILFLVVST